MRFRIWKIKNENWRNYEYCGISNRRTKPKIANFWNRIIVFQNEKKIPTFYNLENHEISIIDKLKKKKIISPEIVEFKKLANF